MIVFDAARADATPALLGEGPIWDERRRRLIWIDIFGKTVHVAGPDGRRRESFPLPVMPGTAMPADDGRILLATEDGFALLDDSGDLEIVSDALAGMPDHRFNDGKTDPSGRVVVGTLSLSGRPDASALYTWEPGAGLRTLVPGVSLSNGLGWSPDGATLYYVDTPTGRVDAFDYDLAAGTASRRRPFARIDGPGAPDGLTVDDDGGVWVADYGGGRVVRFAPDGRVDATVIVPARHVTSCCFGGEGRRTLFITTASIDIPADERHRRPAAGALHRVDVGRSGPAATPWRVAPSARAERTA